MSEASRLWPHALVPVRDESEWDDLWRPQRWASEPAAPHEHTLVLASLLAVLVYANLIVNEVLAPPWYVPFNVAVMAIGVFIARAAGVTWISIGFRTDRLARGVGLGMVFGAVAALAIIALALVPAFDEVFADERVTDRSFALTTYHAFIRIPLGTALYEEVMFRGLLFGILARRYSFLTAALGSSVLFGLWHVLPTIDTTQTNPAADLFGADFVTVLLGVAATTVAGLVFVWLRGFGRSIATPVIVHLAFNSTAVLVAALMVDVT
ncbi:MAG: CPBP family intramembrane glutamic endopeptidase [Acidimicrobiia bacterium]